MLPELRLMLPDSKLGTNGFHDALIDNLSASPAWRSSHISPADVTCPICEVKIESALDVHMINSHL